MPSNDDFRHYAIEVKPIGAACNLRCEYCYYLGKGSGDKAAPALMADDVLENYIRQVIDIHGQYAEIEFAWHGGEPTMCGIPFYEKAMALQQKYGKGRRILNTLQTNGTLLTDDWCQFFHDNQFRIGLSIDGPEHLHNIYRKDAHGEGTFARTMHGHELLQKHGVEFNTLTTVNAANADHAKEVYNFLREFSNFMQFLPVVERRTTPQPLSGKERDGHIPVAIPPGLYTSPKTREGQGEEIVLAPFSVSAEAYGKFLCTVFDEWARKDIGKKFVQVIEATIGNLTHRPAGLCVHESVCGHCGVIEKNGDLYRCDRYVFPEYRAGNIMTDNLYNLMQTNRQFGEYKLENLPPACLHCDVVELCFGGCPKDRIEERLAFSAEYGKPIVERRNYLCSGYKMFFQYIKKHFGKIR